MRLRHMGPPMLPTPIYPTFMISSREPWVRLQHIRFNTAMFDGLPDWPCTPPIRGRSSSSSQQEVRMSDPTKPFTDMFKTMGEQLKVPSFDMQKIMEHQQKNLDAMARTWQVAASGAQEIARKQREILEAAVRDIT